MVSTLTLKQVEVADRKIATYLATLAGRNPERFCAPTIDGIRRAAAWAQPDDFIRERLEHLASIGRITPTVRTLHGRRVSGFTVLPRRLWERENGAPRGKAQLTSEDVEWLHCLLIRWDADPATAGSGRGTRGTEPRAIAAADGGGL